ncbi:MAG: prepilin-type N-terminal cleavage/methylation domain-containing protein [Magnetococcales bacterium]|nr:prepilin-type N-terminal cleavage/methylation domain-containing protein [Magnetococcales bacterium]
MPQVRVERTNAAGFTLIEIAIVVVIIGLLLGGVLKGQEMIRNARAHNVADQGNAVKAAILGFSDRYRALPGDYAAALNNIPGLSGVEQNGDGNSRIGFDDRAVQGTPDEPNRLRELGLTWLHLARSGFISGNYLGTAFGATDEANWACPTDTCLTNAFNGAMIIAYDNEQTGLSDLANQSRSNQLWSGRGIPIEIISELDRKVDDGHPGTGSFRVGDGFVGGTTGAVGHQCVDDGAETPAAPNMTSTWPQRWTIVTQVSDCGGVYQF